MKKIMLLAWVMLVIGAVVSYGDQRASGQDMDVIPKEARMDKIKVFVNGFEAYAKKIIENYKKEVAGIDAKDKIEKHNKMMDNLGQYFRDAKFTMDEWLLIQQEFDKRYEIGKAEYDQLGSEVAYDMVRNYSEKNLPQSLNNLLVIIADKNYNTELRTKYVNYIRGILHEVLYYDGGKFKISIDDEMKSKIVDVLAANISDKKNDLTLRKDMVFLLAGYFGENEKAATIILNILDDSNENEEIKVQAIFGADLKFGVAKDERILEKLIDILKNRNNHSVDTVNETMRSSCYLGNKDAINIGIDILNTAKDENSLFRETLSSLSITNDKEAIKAILKNSSKFNANNLYSFYQKDEILLDIMNTEPEEYSILAIEALGINSPKEPTKVIKALEQKLYDKDLKIKLVAMDAIRKIGQRQNTETRNEILAILNKAKTEEKNEEVLNKIENSIKTLEGGQ